MLPTRRKDSGGKNNTLRSGESMCSLMTHAEQSDKQEETVCEPSKKHGGGHRYIADRMAIQTGRGVPCR